MDGLLTSVGGRRPTICFMVQCSLCHFIDCDKNRGGIRVNNHKFFGFPMMHLEKKEFNLLLLNFCVSLIRPSTTPRCYKCCPCTS